MMKSISWWAGILIVTTLAPGALAKGGGASGHTSLDRIGTGPGSERVDADKANVGKTPTLPSSAKQAVRRAGKTAGKSAGKD